MKSTIFRYGIYSTLTIVAISAIQFFVILPNVSYDISEISGYLTMVLSMVFVFAGIRHYRNHVNNGTLTFGQGMKVGILIVLIPSVAFGLFDLLYTEVLNPSWLNDYYNHYKEKLISSTPADKLAGKLSEMEKMKEVFSNPVFQFLLMAGTVFIIGLIATIISALTLRRTKTTSS
jgi:hypothetical protein